MIIVNDNGESQFPILNQSDHFLQTVHRYKDINATTQLDRR